MGARRTDVPRLAGATASAVLLGVVLCLGAIVTWRADVNGAAATTAETDGLLETTAYQGEVERAEIQARTEQRTYNAYLAATLRARALGRRADTDVVAEVEKRAALHLAERLLRQVPADLVVRAEDDLVEERSFDADARTRELLRIAGTRNDSGESFARATEHRRRRAELLAANLVLFAGLTVASAAQFARRETVLAAGNALVVLAAGYTGAVLASVGF